jgi:electron transfer flavoprotein alpha subunit
LSDREVWVLAEQRLGKVSPVSYELLNRGKALAEKLGSPLCACILGYNITKGDTDELIYRGADKVYVVDDARLEDFLIEPYSKIMLSLMEEEKPEIVLAAATTTGRTLMPYIAVKKRTG